VKRISDAQTQAWLRINGDVTRNIRLKNCQDFQLCPTPQDAFANLQHRIRTRRQEFVPYTDWLMRRDVCLTGVLSAIPAWVISVSAQRRKPSSQTSARQCRRAAPQIGGIERSPRRVRERMPRLLRCPGHLLCPPASPHQTKRHQTRGEQCKRSGLGNHRYPIERERGVERPLTGHIGADPFPIGR
jgi:hypothetical protein